MTAPTTEPTVEPLRLHEHAEPLPDAVQRLRACVFPAVGTTIDDLVLDAVRAVIGMAEED